MIKSSAKRIRQLAVSHSGSRSSSEDDDSDYEPFWYICGTCNQAFQEERKVKKHRKRIHFSKRGQIILVSDKELQPQIILKRSSLEDNIVNVNGDEVRRSCSRVSQEFHSESDQLAPENSSITRLKRKWSKRQSQTDTSTNEIITDTQHELVHMHRISTKGDCLPRGGSTDAAAEALPPSPRLELSKKITSSNNSHLLTITQNELLPQVKLVRCERTAIHPAGAGSSVMVERNNQNDSNYKDTCSVDEGNDSLKKRKRGRPKKDQQELRPGEGEVSLQNFPSETINSKAHLKVEACISPVPKVVSNVETPDLKIEGYTLAEEHNSLELAELVDIPDNKDNLFNSSPSPQPELVPLSRDKPLVLVSPADVQQEQESHNLDYHCLELEEHKRFEQEIMIVANDEYVKEERDDDNRARNLRPRKQGQGEDSWDNIEDPYSENNEKNDDEGEDDELDQDYDECLYENEDSTSDAESTSSCEIPGTKTPTPASPSSTSTSRQKEKGADTTSPKKPKMVTVKKKTNKEKKPKEERVAHQCKLCGKIYEFARPFVIHMKTVHQQQVTTNEKRFNCTLCEKGYIHKRDLKKHLRNHKWIASGQGSCTICQRSFNCKESLTYHMGVYHSTTTTSEFLCSFCGQGFPTQLNLSVHARKHSEKVFKCEVEGCGARFRSRSQWNRHNVSHTGARPYRCSNPACSQAFKTKHSMEVHKSVHQPHLRPFKCPECPKTYKNWSNMKYHHKATHLGVKVSFKCETCEKSFSRKATLQTHELEEHGKPLEKIFECQVCKKQFASNAQLKKHAIIHATSLAYQCTTCGKGFKCPSNLATHSASHLSEEEKKWSCEICGKKFALPHHLRQHASAHGGGGGGRSRKSSSRPRDPLR